MNNLNHSENDSWDIESQLITCGEALKENFSITQHVVERTVVEVREGLSKQPVEPCRSRPFSLFPPMERSKVMRTLSIGTLAAASLLLFVRWTTEPNVSFAQAIATVQKVTSYFAEVSMVERGSDKSERTMFTGKLYWQAPDQSRAESIFGQPASPGGPPRQQIEITSGSKKGIRLLVNEKTYEELPPQGGAKSPMMMLQNLRNYQNVSTKNLGNKTIQGIPCAGYLVDLRDVDPDAGGGEMEVWIDHHRQLPQYVVVRMSLFATAEMIMQNFRWNEALDPHLFSAEPPPQYRQQVAEKVQSTDDQVAVQIADAFRLFAEFNGGKYPQVKVIYGDVALARLRELSGMSLTAPIDSSRDATLRKKSLRIDDSAVGWGEATRIMRQDASAQYNGLTVSPNDQEKVLFKWRRTDGKFQVIYGDLRVSILDE